MADNTNAHFMRYTGVRPKAIDPRYPHYNPERDFGQIAVWLLSVHSAINIFSLDRWMAHAVSMGIVEPGNTEGLKASLNESLDCLIGFLEDACGAPIGDRAGEIIQDDAKLVSFQDAMARFRDNAGPAGLLVQAMLGECASDMLFFAGRQERLIGMQGPQTLDKILPTIQAYGNAIRSGEVLEDHILAGIRTVAELAYATGMPISMVIRAVETHLLDLQTRMTGN